MVNSVSEISNAVAISGETFEKHGHLEPQVFDNTPVNEVLGGILFSDYPPKITTELANLYAFPGETIEINGITWTVEKRTNSLATLVAQLIGSTTTELLNKTFSAAEKDLKTQDVTYGTALSLQANNTIKATVTDESSMTAVIERTAKFPFPIIVGAFNNNNLCKIIINKVGSVYNLTGEDIYGNNIASNQLEQLILHKYVGNGKVDFAINTSDTMPLACVIAKGNSFKSFVQKGQVETPITLNKVRTNFAIEFQIGGVTKWEQNDFTLNATTDAFTQSYTAAVTFEPQY